MLHLSPSSEIQTGAAVTTFLRDFAVATMPDDADADSSAYDIFI